MKKGFLIGLFFPFVICFSCTAQNNSQVPHKEFKNVAGAYYLAIKGYKDKVPSGIVNAAVLFINSPLRGEFKPDSIVMLNAEIMPAQFGDKKIEFNTVALLNDAAALAGSDSNLLSGIAEIREEIKKDSIKSRGRKFSPLIQEYSLLANGVVKLWATFTGNELAEIYVSGNGNSAMDLFLTDKNGRMIASDIKKTNECYVSFTPQATQQFSIEIRNSGKNTNQCLLMTN
jgi:hypothetical protein